MNFDCICCCDFVGELPPWLINKFFIWLPKIEPPRSFGLFDYVFGGSGNNNDEGDSGNWGLNCDPFKNYSWNLNKFIYSKKFLVRVKQIKIFVN